MTDCSISLGSASADAEDKALGIDIAMELAREGLRLSFPCKLFAMLDDAEEKGFRHIASWNAEGNGFMVHDSAAFLKTIIPQYFNQTKYKSFQRQLSLYGFTRIAAGRRKGLRFHSNFTRGSKQLCKQMRPITKESKSISACSSTSKEASSGASSSSTSNTHTQVASSTTTTTSVSPSSKPSTAEKAPAEQGGPENIVVPQTAQIFKGPSLVQSDSQCSFLVDQNPTANGMIGDEKRSSMISPELPPIAPKLYPCLLTLQQEEAASIGCFEGKTFFLMSTTSIIEKRKQHPEPPSMITTFAPVASTTTDDAIDTQLRRAWEQGFAKALSIPTLSSEPKPLPSKADDVFELGFWSQSNSFLV
jgi:hypothetical protein